MTALPRRTIELARAFAVVADDYDLGRPGYAPGVLDVLRERAGVEPGRTILDLAAGTGRLTRLLTGAGLDVVAVEPLAGLRERVDAGRVLDGTAESIPLEDASADAAVVADAWHWFDGPRAADELARVVKPGGGVALLWQMPDEAGQAAWRSRVGELLDPLMAGHPGFTADQGRGALARHPAFGPLRRDVVASTWEPAPETFLAYLMSSSFVGVLAEAERAALRRELAAALPDEPLRLGFETRIWTTRRR